MYNLKQVSEILTETIAILKQAGNSLLDHEKRIMKLEKQLNDKQK